MTMILKNNNFNTIVYNSKLALVDFYAEWCSPCRKQFPIVEEISNEFKDIIVGKVNVEEESELSNIFKITTIPTLIIFKNGKIIEKIYGFHTKTQLKTVIEKYL